MLSRTANNTTKQPCSGRSTPPEIAVRILSLAREGWTRTAIAKDCGVSDKVVTSICHKNGFCFPRGGDQYGNKSQQEAPSWVYEERFQAAFRKRRALRGDNLD